MQAIQLEPIGLVRNGERDIGRVDWRGIRSEIALDEAFAPMLLGLDDYSHVLVVGWLHEAPPEALTREQAYPSGDASLPLQGSLALRGGRPNPLSVTVCRLDGIEGATLRLRDLDLVDGTPVLDVKPYIAFYDAVPEATLPAWAQG